MAKHVCPVWVGYLLSSRLRRLVLNPAKLLEPYIKQGMVVLDIGCAMGFFSLEAAKFVGEAGRVICVDVQAKMIDVLNRRAAKQGLVERIDSRVCSDDSLGVDDINSSVDVVLACNVIHETEKPAAMLSQMYAALKPGGIVLLVEPKGHVSEDEFHTTEGLALSAGFTIQSHPVVRRSLTVLLRKG